MASHSILDDGEAFLHQTPSRTLLTVRATAQIVAMASWKSDAELPDPRITPPRRVEIPVVVNGCLEAERGLEVQLIAKAECVRCEARWKEVAVEFMKPPWFEGSANGGISSVGKPA